MIELSKVQREIKVYINDSVFVFDDNKATSQQFLGRSGFAINEYNIYLVKDYDNKKSKQIKNNETIGLETGMHFIVALRTS